MPIYEYECQDCKQIFEEWQGGFEERELDCPVCGAAAKRLISNTSFHLKGTGWYVTDYAGKKPSDSSKSEGGDNGNGNGNGNGSGAKPADEKAAQRQAVKEAATPAQPPAGGGKASDPAA